MGLGVLEGTKPSQVDGFEVGWRDDQGEHRLPLADAVSVPFEAGRPVRGFPSYRGQRHFPGQGADQGRMPPFALLDIVPEREAEKAVAWERHVTKVEFGRPLDAGPTALPRQPRMASHTRALTNSRD
ncbi:hypothetical protein [Streptomyces sp. NPDC018000]|uniref:hypothetical protein n=1 Tax=Streptomyces sp. NPDC018000 TaxID=3365028 RepID=UPI0037BB3534